MADPMSVTESESVAHPYRPLARDNIRVLCLLPGHSQASGPLRARLELVNLSCRGGSDNYEAISYAWESLETPHELHIAGYGLVHITASLFTALRALRLKDRQRRLWADAICIDQTDGSERAAQVSIMAHIFGSASKVLVWLGNGEPSDALAFATAYHCKTTESVVYDIEDSDLESMEFDRDAASENADAELERLDADLINKPHCPCCEELADIRDDQPAIDGLKAIAAMCNRAWFTRLWTVQEVAVCANVDFHSGPHVLSYDKMIDALLAREMIAGRMIFTDNDAAPSQQLRNYRLMPQQPFAPGMSILKLIELSTRECREPHDRIFAVRNILGIEALEDLMPDYTLSPAEVFRRFVVRCLITDWDTTHAGPGNILILLGLVGTEEAGFTCERRPSWVPNLHRLGPRSRFKSNTYRWHKHQFQPSSLRFRAVLDHMDPDRLMIRGRAFGTIIACAKGCSRPRQWRERDTVRVRDEYWTRTVPDLVTWFGRCRHFITQHLGKEADDTTMLEIMTAGDDREFEFMFLTEMDMPPLEEFRSHAQETEVQADPDRLYAVLKPFLTYASPDSHDLEFCLAAAETDTGVQFAWVPPTVAADDQLCIFAGAPFPFIGRETEDGSFRLLGDAWIHGVKEWQALGMLSETWQAIHHVSHGYETSMDIEKGVMEMQQAEQRQAELDGSLLEWLRFE